MATWEEPRPFNITNACQFDVVVANGWDGVPIALGENINWNPEGTRMTVYRAADVYARTGGRGPGVKVTVDKDLVLTGPMCPPA